MAWATWGGAVLCTLNSKLGHFISSSRDVFRKYFVNVFFARVLASGQFCSRPNARHNYK